MSKMSAKQGENTEVFNVSIEGLTDYTNYYSDLTIINADTDTIVLGPIRIEPSNNQFSVALTPAQTLALPVDSYVAVLEVIKEVTGVVEFRKEVSWSIKITASLLP